MLFWGATVTVQRQPHRGCGQSPWAAPEQRRQTIVVDFDLHVAARTDFGEGASFSVLLESSLGCVPRPLLRWAAVLADASVDLSSEGVAASPQRDMQAVFEQMMAREAEIRREVRSL